MVPKVGLEPTHGFPYQILSLACLPISPFRLRVINNDKIEVGLYKKVY